jgi:integrase
VRLHIKPKLGRVRLDKLTALQLDALYREKVNQLSPRSVQIIHATAHKALKQAAKWKIVRENVAKHATPPRTVKKETDVLAKEQVHVLLTTAKTSQPHLYALWTLAVSTGARLGELLRLQPTDICDTGTMRIARSVHQRPCKPPKTSAGARISRSAKWD